MGKYILLTNGDILNTAGSNNDVITENIRLPNSNDKIEKNSTKISELSVDNSFIFTGIVFGNNEAKKYVINQTEKLRNDSFGFIGLDQNGKALKDRKVEFNSSFNTIFDLDQNEVNDLNLQTFANNLDFYGFPQLIQNPVDLFTRDVLFLFLTLIDSIVASVIPIVTISTLQFLLQSQKEGGNIFNQTSSKKEKIYEFGKYITYSTERFGNGILGEMSNKIIELLSITLNSFERLMNFPAFPEMRNLEFGLGLLKEIGLRIGYFVTGYLFYLVPGLKYNSSLIADVSIATKLLNLLQEFVTINSPRNVFELLFRKIIRNNVFFYKIQGGARKTENLTNDLSDSLSLFGTFFYRFIGQRVAIGEKIVRMHSISSSSNNERLSRTRFPANGNEKHRKLLHNFSSIIPEKANEYKDYTKYLEKSNAYKIELENNNIIRLSKEQVEEIEKIIDLDYVPFSFQDLRNNDIMRFHAFIESISDSYSASYNEMGGYGRLEKIKNYVNTTRTINISFKLVATSPDDFDQMWYSINKIVSMIYPQWSRPVPARQMNINEVGILYHLPFTQIPSNTPMIRLRIGDLFTSNYTKVTASKLFGFEKDLKSNKKIKTLDFYNFFKKIIKEHQKGHDISNDFSEETQNNITGIEFEVKSNNNYKVMYTIQSIDLLEIINSDNEIDFLSNEQTNTKEVYENKYSLYAGDNEEIFSYIFYSYDENEMFESQISSELTDKIKNYIKSAQAISESLDNFMKSEVAENGNTLINNSITKAYETTYGKGLAGHITSLGIDWEQTTPWDIDKDRRAPIMVKITIGFSPVHDIPLGLDHNGTMRAVPYMVGNEIHKRYKSDTYYQYDENEFK